MSRSKIDLLTQSLLSDSASPKFQSKFQKTFAHLTDSQIQTLVAECLKYLQLIIISNRSLFFPGNADMDEVWHSFITETQFYEDLCLKLGSSHIVHHSGIPYEDYKIEVSAERLHEEQLSWLASYFYNFGEFSAESLAVLPLARSILSRLNLDLTQLNQLGHSLSAHFISNSAAPETWTSLVNSIQEKAHLLDSNSQQLSQTLSEISNFLSQQGPTPILCSNEQLRDLYYASTSVGFLIAQHWAAMERILDRPEWQHQNKDLWNSLSSFQSMVGLGTTHIGHENPILRGLETSEGYILNGSIPWMSGFNIFDAFVIGFQCNQNNIFVTISSDSLQTQKGFQIQKHTLAAFQGTNTVSVSLKDVFVSNKHVLSKTPYGVPSKLSQSRYIFPELGMALRALDEVEVILNKKKDSLSKDMQQEIQNTEKKLRDRIQILVQTTILPLPLGVQLQKDEVLRSSVRLLNLVDRGSALNKKSLSYLLTAQSMIFDAVVQSDELILRKMGLLV